MMSSTIGDKNLLQKRIPRNPRYEHIRSTLDTGSSLTNYLQKLQKKHNDYKVLDNEIFKRIKPLAFARLVLETSLEFDLDSHEKTNMTFLSQYANNSRSNSVASTTRSPSVQSNMSMDSKSSRHYQHSDKATDNVLALMTDPPIQSKEQIHFQRQERQAIALRKRQQHSVPYNPELPYLLLDIRDSDSFVRCHIVGAMNFPAILIKRDQLTSEFIYFRNKPNKLIIVYDEDESIAGLAAQTLCERGIENVYLLSGGLKLLSQKVGGIILGKLPPSCSMPALPNRSSLPPIRAGSRTSTYSGVSTSHNSRYSSVTKRANPNVISVENDTFNLEALKRSLETASSTGSSVASSQSRPSSMLSKRWA